MELFLIDKHNYRYCYILDENGIKRVEDNRNRKIFNGCCGLLDGKVIGYFTLNHELYLYNNGEIIKINPENIKCTHTRLDRGYNLIVNNNNIDVINMNYIPFEDPLYYCEEDDFNIAESMESFLNSPETVAEAIYNFENYEKVFFSRK